MERRARDGVCPFMRKASFSLISLFVLGCPRAVLGQEPQLVPDAQRREGETLTEPLGRTEGVIKPAETDPDIQVTPPANAQSDMPVIKPPAPPQE